MLVLAMGAAAGFAAGLAVVAAAAAFAAGAGDLPAEAGSLTGTVAIGFGAATGCAGAAGFAAEPGFAFASASEVLPRPNACSTEARKSTSMRSGDPEEYSAWNITFHDWQIMRSRMIGS